MAWTSPTTWVAGAVLTAAQLNAQIRDNLKAIGDPWTAYTPAWTGATTNPAIGNGSKVGQYAAAGKLITFSIRIVTGSTTTYGSGAYSLSLPVTESAGRWSFSGVLRQGTATYPIFAERAVSGEVLLRVLPTTAGDRFTSFAQGTPATIVAGDEIFISGTYEAA